MGPTHNHQIKKEAVYYTPACEWPTDILSQASVPQTAPIITGVRTTLGDRLMAEGSKQQPDIEPDDAATPGRAAVAPKGNSGRRSFSNLRRELTDDELSTPAVQRMLLDEIERLDGECDDLRSTRDKYHSSDKRVGVLEERFKTKISLEIMHVVCFLLSGSALGYAASNWASQPTVSMLALIFGGVLAIAGVVAKVVRP